MLKMLKIYMFFCFSAFRNNIKVKDDSKKLYLVNSHIVLMCRQWMWILNHNWREFGKNYEIKF